MNELEKLLPNYKRTKNDKHFNQIADKLLSIEQKVKDGEDHNKLAIELLEAKLDLMKLRPNKIASQTKTEKGGQVIEGEYTSSDKDVEEMRDYLIDFFESNKRRA